MPGHADITTGMPKAHCWPPNSGHQASLWVVCASVIGGFIKRLLMKVTHTEGQAAQDAGLHGEEMRLLKCVMRDRTNPQYRPTLSLNPLMIGAFSLVRRTVCYKPLWPGGVGARGWDKRGGGVAGWKKVFPGGGGQPRLSLLGFALLCLSWYVGLPLSL